MERALGRESGAGPDPSGGSTICFIIGRAACPSNLGKVTLPACASMAPP